jgi:uncharacterized protein (TIGR00730 family)
MRTISSICVYCGSAVGNRPVHRAAAHRLGEIMAADGIRLVYGGGRIGLMGVLADAVLAGGGAVTGVIPAHLETREKGHRGVTELRIVDSMHARKNTMFELADAFVILPGGLGTLDETFEILTWRQLGLHDKPILLVDIDGYWQPFLRLFEHLVACGFVRPDYRRLFEVIDGVEAVLPALRRLPEPQLREATELF